MAAAPKSATTGAPAASPLTACPVGLAVDVLSSRWTTPVLWTLNEFGRQRFVELQRRIDAITPKVLTQRLRQLERDGMIRRDQYAEVPPRVEYEITDLGASLAPIFAQLTGWGAANADAIEHARAAYDAKPSTARAHHERATRTHDTKADRRR